MQFFYFSKFLKAFLFFRMMINLEEIKEFLNRQKSLNPIFVRNLIKIEIFLMRILSQIRKKNSFKKETFIL